MCDICTIFEGGSDDQNSYEMTVDIPGIGEATTVVQGNSPEHAAFVAGVLSMAGEIARHPLGEMFVELLALSAKAARESTVSVKDVLGDESWDEFMKIFETD